MANNGFAEVKVLISVKAGKCVDCSNFLRVNQDFRTCLCSVKQSYRTNNALRRCICHHFVPEAECYLCKAALVCKEFDRGAIVKVYACSDPKCQNFQEDW